jgi:hypothetical protein
VENADLIKVQNHTIQNRISVNFYQISKLFTDQLTLDNLPRPQLVPLLDLCSASPLLNHISMISPLLALSFNRFISLGAGVDVPPVEHG